MTFKQLKNNLQREILFQIIFRMRHKSLTTDRASQIAQEILSVMKNEEIADNLLNNTAKLCQYFPEISQAYVKTAKQYDDEMKEEKINGINFYLQNGDVDLALDRIRKGGGN